MNCLNSYGWMVTNQAHHCSNTVEQFWTSGFNNNKLFPMSTSPGCHTCNIPNFGPAPYAEIEPEHFQNMPEMSLATETKWLTNSNLPNKLKILMLHSPPDPHNGILYLTVKRHTTCLPAKAKVHPRWHWPLLPHSYSSCQSRWMDRSLLKDEDHLLYTLFDW